MNEIDQLKLLTKSAFIGHAHKLPNKGCSQDKIEGWQTCITANLAEDETLKLESFKFLWRRDDYKKVATIPPRGVAGNINQLIYLMADNRIDRESVGLTLPEWTEMMGVQEWQSKDIEEVPAGPENNPPARPAVPAKPRAEVRSNFDKLVNYITTDFYSDEEFPGATTDAYFDDVKASRKSMDKIYKTVEMFLPEDLKANFKNGAYGSWTATSKAVLRLHGHDECQETMMDHFMKFREIVKSSKRMEVKVGKFRELIRKIMVDSTDPGDWIKAEDFPGDMTAYQTAPERYGSFANTMLQWSVFWHCIPDDRLMAIQTEYHNLLKDHTYKSWHGNRPELYKILDRETKRQKSINSVNRGRRDSDDGIMWTGSRGKKGKNQSNMRISKGFNKNQSKGFAKSNKFKNQGSGGKSKGSMDLRKAEKMLRMKCKMCSGFAKTIICHKGPYNGKGNNCLYTKDGKRKSKRGAINEVDLPDESNDEESDFSNEDALNYASGVSSTDESAGSGISEYSNNEEDDTGVYGIREGSTLPAFKNDDGTCAMGNYE